MNYTKVWNVMNDLEMVTCKIVSAREILDSAMDRLQEHQYDKTETLLCAVDEFLQYYLSEFDTKFKDAWKETVLQLKQEENDAYVPFSCDKDDTSPECKSAWNSFWEEAANLEVGDEVETLTHDEMIAKGYTMTADGFWFKE